MGSLRVDDVITSANVQTIFSINIFWTSFGGVSIASIPCFVELVQQQQHVEIRVYN